MSCLGSDICGPGQTLRAIITDDSTPCGGKRADNGVCYAMFTNGSGCLQFDTPDKSNFRVAVCVGAGNDTSATAASVGKSVTESAHFFLQGGLNEARSIDWGTDAKDVNDREATVLMSARDSNAEESMLRAIMAFTHKTQ